MGEAGLARTFDTIKETTGLDLVGLINETMATKQGNKEIVQAIESKRDDVPPVIVAEEK
jgi:flotillin